MVAAFRVGDPGRRLALKVPRADVQADPRQLARAADEAAILRQLQHPGLLHVHHLLEYDGRWVVESEFVDGIGLDAVLRNGRVEPADAVFIAQQVALALEAAWSTPSAQDGRPLHLVHRDLKPGNILLTRAGGVKVVDFGLASSRFTPLELGDARVRGTPGYAAPEPLTGADLPAVDLYALGATLLELLLGRPALRSRKPDRHDSDVDKALEHVRRLALPVGLTDPLCELLADLLAFAPDRRPTLADATVRLTLLATHPAFRPDLAALVPPRSPPSAPRTHPEWATVAFLETELPVARAASMPAAMIEAEVREILLSPDWMENLPGLRRLLARSETPVRRPFLDLLTPRGWKFWKRAFTPREQEGALLLLTLDPTDEVLERAIAFRDHPDPRVARAAERILTGR